MKGFISKVLILLFIGVMFLIPFDSSSVKAAQSLNQVVYYQSLVESGSKQTALTVVSQYRYKITNDMGRTDSDGNPLSGLATKSSFDSINSDNICTNFNVGGVCAGGKLPGSLATLTISADGDVVFALANGVELENLHFYYIIANMDGGMNQLYCSKTSMCEEAKIISSVQNVYTKWTNQTNAGNMWYGSYSIKDNFSVSESASGVVTYKNYNLIDKMSASLASQAKTHGAYVVSAYSVKYNNKTYYVNYDLVERSAPFKSVGNESSSSVQNAMTCSSPTSKTGCTNLVDTVSKAAALITSPMGAGPTASEGYGVVHEFFVHTGIPILKIIIILMFLITGTMTMIHIVQASDEPEVRRSEIKRFIGLFTGALVIYLILLFYEEIIAMVSGWLS